VATLLLADTCEIDATAVIRSLTGEPKHFMKEKKALSAYCFYLTIFQ